MPGRADLAAGESEIAFAGYCKLVEFLRNKNETEGNRHRGPQLFRRDIGCRVIFPVSVSGSVLNRHHLGRALIRRALARDMSRVISPNNSGLRTNPSWFQLLDHATRIPLPFSMPEVSRVSTPS